VSISKSEVVQPDEVVEFAGEGMPVYNSYSGSRGSLFVHVSVDFPNRLSDEQLKGKNTN
jgi:DnaJ-class molecular chaperone